MLNSHRALLLVMTCLGLGLAINPYTNKINTSLLKGTTWLFSGIVNKFLK